MTRPTLSSETLHVSCVAKDGAAILIAGPSGAGKSDLALRLIARGAMLVSDDYTVVRRVKGQLLASAPGTIAGKLEVRGVGIIEMESVSDVPVCLYVDLERPVERLPESVDARVIAGVNVPVVAVSGLEASAPDKVEIALSHLGLKP